MHTFADDHGPYDFVPRLDWLQDSSNIPKWHPGIPFFLGLDEPGDDSRCEEFVDYINSPVGAIRWHMFCETAYTFPMRDGVERLNVDKVVGSVNATGNQIFTIEGAVDPKSVKEVQLQNHIGTMMARLFNYYHCKQLGRLELFKLRARAVVKHSCPACGCGFGSKGFVYQPPTNDVSAENWAYEDRLENGGSDQSPQETKI